MEKAEPVICIEPIQIRDFFRRLRGRVSDRRQQPAGMLTQREAAIKAGLTVSAAARCENDPYGVGFSIVRDLADAFGFHMAVVFYRK